MRRFIGAIGLAIVLVEMHANAQTRPDFSGTWIPVETTSGTACNGWWSAANGIKTQPLLPGTLDLLVLRTLALEAMHGFGISVRLKQISRGVFRVNPGSLFPAFRRLERDGLIKGDWRDTENNRRARYYSLTARGRSALKAQTDSWETQVEAIGRFLNASPEER